MKMMQTKTAINTPIAMRNNLCNLRRISSLRRNHSQRLSKYSLARRTISCHRILMNNRPSWSFKQRQLNQAITITLRLTEHVNIFLNTYPVVVFSDLSVQPLLPCTRSQQCFTTATIPSGSAILNTRTATLLYCDVAFTRCE